MFVYSTTKSVQGSTTKKRVVSFIFVIYVNEILSCIKYCHTSLYADNTIIYLTSTNVLEVEEKLNFDLANLSQWLKENF